jgi:hypothetical protein
MLKTIAIAVALFGGVAAPAVFHASPAAAPQPGGKSFQPQSSQSQTTASQSFAATCSASAKKVDSRVDPAWVGQSFAGDGCSAPGLPKPVDGYTASRARILAGMAAQKKYIAEADVYQRCIMDYVAGRRATADKGAKPMAVALVIIESHRLSASKASKQRVADQANETIRAFNEAGSEDCK